MTTMSMRIASRLRAVSTRVSPLTTEDPLDAINKVNVPSRYDDTFAAIVRHPAIVDIIADLMGGQLGDVPIVAEFNAGEEISESDIERSMRLMCDKVMPAFK